MEISSVHLHSQTVRARKLKFLEKVHLSPPVMCKVSHVMCHVSHVTSHVSHFWFFFVYKEVELVGGGSVINGAYPSSFLYKTNWQFPIIGPTN